MFKQETGTHIGAANGHWIEVDENGQVVNDVITDMQKDGVKLRETA